MQRDTVTVERFYTDHADALEHGAVAGAPAAGHTRTDGNRPGLALAGFTRYFSRIAQVMGNAECHFEIASILSVKRGIANPLA